MQITADLELFNDEVDNSRHLFDQTFDVALNSENRAAVNSNIDVMYASLATRSDRIVSEIANVLERYGL
jgi:hypothetical protein